MAKYGSFAYGSGQKYGTSDVTPGSVGTMAQVAAAVARMVARASAGASMKRS